MGLVLYVCAWRTKQKLPRALAKQRFNSTKPAGRQLDDTWIAKLDKLSFTHRDSVAVHDMCSSTHPTPPHTRHVYALWRSRFAGLASVCATLPSALGSSLFQPSASAATQANRYMVHNIFSVHCSLAADHNSSGETIADGNNNQPRLLVTSIRQWPLATSDKPWMLADQQPTVATSGRQ